MIIIITNKTIQITFHFNCLEITLLHSNCCLSLYFHLTQIKIENVILIIVKYNFSLFLYY